VKGRVDGQPVSKILIDGGAAINIMPSVDVNMVFMLPMEFLALSDDKEEVVLSDQVAPLALDPMMVVF
jgi:hypothetical protein